MENKTRMDLVKYNGGGWTTLEKNVEVSYWHAKEYFEAVIEKYGEGLYGVMEIPNRKAPYMFVRSNKC